MRTFSKWLGTERAAVIRCHMLTTTCLHNEIQSLDPFVCRIPSQQPAISCASLKVQAVAWSVVPDPADSITTCDGKGLLCDERENLITHLA